MQSGSGAWSAIAQYVMGAKEPAKSAERACAIPVLPRNIASATTVPVALASATRAPRANLAAHLCVHNVRTPTTMITQACVRRAIQLFTYAVVGRVNPRAAARATCQCAAIAHRTAGAAIAHLAAALIEWIYSALALEHLSGHGADHPIGCGAARVAVVWDIYVEWPTHGTRHTACDARAVFCWHRAYHTGRGTTNMHLF
jgi:hypothetical protein